MKEVLKLALEALDALCLNDYSGYEMGKRDTHLVDSAIDAIKAALAQTVQEPDHGDELTIAYMSGVHRGKELAAQPVQEPWCMKMNGCKTKCADCPDEPAQEPVAWLDEEKKIIYWHNTHETDDYHGFRRTTPLYTTPQQRPWMGLTDEDHMQFAISQFGWDELIAAVEAKLKEKNA
jgi:hypothetical protein